MSTRLRRRAGPALALLALMGLAACGTPEPPHPAHQNVPEGTAVSSAAAPAPTVSSSSAVAPSTSGQAPSATAVNPAAQGAAAPPPAASAPAAASAQPPAPRVDLPATSAPQVALAVPGPLPGPEKLVGLTGPELTALLGDPGFVRRDAPAEIWQYRDGDCVLDLFLYEPESKRPGPARVTHYEFRGRTVETVSENACYLRFVAAARRSHSGG